jgi:biopolymer transport protein TolR
MGMAVGPKGGIKSDINVTPLVDVVLVLLIIFMVITPMLQRGKDVKLPRAERVEAEKKGADPIIVSVTPDKAMWIESDSFTEQQFTAELRLKMAAKPGAPILLKGDEKLTFEDVRKVMNLARQAGAKAMSLGVEEDKKP